MGDLFNTIIGPIEWLVAWIMYLFHQGFTAIGMDPASGWTWALSIVGLVGNLEPGSKHGFHVHDKGDCSAADASSAGRGGSAIPSRMAAAATSAREWTPSLARTAETWWSTVFGER